MSPRRMGALAGLMLLLCAPLLAAQSPPRTSSMTDGRVVAMLIAIDERDVEASKIALLKGLSPPVAVFGQLMVKERGENLEKSRQLSRSAGLAPDLSPAIEGLEANSQASREQLDRLVGAEVEAAYIELMVKDHAEALEMLDRDLIPAASNAELAEHLRSTREQVALHLEQARALRGAQP